MRLFMCVNYPIYNPSLGICKKLKSQIETFKKLGFEVTYTAYTRNGAAVYRDNEPLREIRYSPLIPHRFYWVMRKFVLQRLVRDYLNEGENRYEVGFVRWGAVDRSFLKTMACMDAKCGKIIMDCHGYFKNYTGKSLKEIYTKITTKRNGGRLKDYIDICLTESRDTEQFGIPAIPMDTGIDVDKYEKHKYCGKPDELHLISVTSEKPYHGYDRIIRGVAEAGNEKIFVHLIGKISEKTKKLARKLNVQDRVIFYGYKTGKELDDIYGRCNLGIGPLAPHRTGGKEGTGIKTKEFFAIGLPYFFAGQELLVPDDYPYVLKMQADDTPIDLNEVVRFYEKIKADPAVQDNMRAFAKEYYSWEKIFRKTLDAVQVRYESV